MGTETWPRNLQKREFPSGLWSGYFQESDASKYWMLSTYYESQSWQECNSIACLSMVMGAAHSPYGMIPVGESLRQEDLLMWLIHTPWQSVLEPGGGGATLLSLRQITEAALARYGFEGFSVEEDYVFDDSVTTRTKFIRDLTSNESNRCSFMILHFLSSHTHAGHYACVGGYDARTEKVLLLDPDPAHGQRYWMGVDKLAKAMKSVSPINSLPRGYLRISFRD